MHRYILLTLVALTVGCEVEVPRTQWSDDDVSDDDAYGDDDAGDDDSAAMPELSRPSLIEVPESLNMGAVEECMDKTVIIRIRNHGPRTVLVHFNSDALLEAGFIVPGHQFEDVEIPPGESHERGVEVAPELGEAGSVYFGIWVITSGDHEWYVPVSANVAEGHNC